MLYMDNAHRDFYAQHDAGDDCYMQALVYTLGMHAATREHWHDIWDSDAGCVRADAVHASWQTSTTAQVTRLALQLYTDGVPSDDADECRRYSVSDVFASPLAPYMWQAVQLRYADYLPSL